LLIEMGPSGVTKARALADLRTSHWPDRTLIAIGDMPNDAAMLAAADLPMTVETGHESLRTIARRILPGPDQDGVAVLLEELTSH
jgi:hydroxymethylpyrimidine pyrophosphatase-like HAD family hydrolase